MPSHPFEPLTPEEIAFATAAVKPRLTDEARFASVTLDEPPKDLIDRVRMARLVIVPGPRASVIIEASVRLDTGEVESWVERDGVTATIGSGGAFDTLFALRRDDRSYPERDDQHDDDLTPSFTVDGSRLDWQKWSLRASIDPAEGLVLHQITYARRSIMYRASISDVVVPFGDPGAPNGGQDAFDPAVSVPGRRPSPLQPGYDCPRGARYLDWHSADEHGNPSTTENAVGIYEEDQQRRLVVLSVATVGSYEYGLYWYFYPDGSIQLEIRITGVLSTRPLRKGEADAFAPEIAPGLAAPVHQHLFCARLDLDIDGVVNEVYELNVDPVPMPAPVTTVAGNAFAQEATRLETEFAAQRVIDPARARVWKIVNRTAHNSLGGLVGYQLVPGPTPTLHAGSDGAIGEQATFASHNLWVTPYAAEERRAAGDYPNQAAGDGLPRFTADNRALLHADIVVWHVFGVTHIPRPEDWPVMPVESCGFHLVPEGFFDHNPAVDTPDVAVTPSA